MVHIYYGDGKGKTTAAVGLAIRASGTGKTVLFTQFLKSDISGERRILECIPSVKMPKLPQKLKFIFDTTPEEHMQFKKDAVELYRYLLRNFNKYDMVIADEIFSAVDVGFITLSDIRKLIDEFPKEKDLILTGHSVDKSIIAYADYVSIITKVKHPHDDGMKARRGIDY